MIRLFTILSISLILATLSPPVHGQGMFGGQSPGGTINPGRSTAVPGLNLGNGGSFEGIGNTGQVDSSSRFMRGNQSEFVGANTSGAFVGISQATGGAAQGRNRTGRPGGAQQFSTDRGTGNRRGSDLRFPLTLGFSVKRPPANQQATELEGLMNKLLKSWRLEPIEVTMEHRTATLKGVVVDPHHRRLAERLALLEPGVDAVRNEIRCPEEIPSPSN
jgi:hypothetical protein